MRRIEHVEELGPAVHGHRELLTGEVGGAHRRAGGQVPHAHRVAPRAEAEGAVEEVPVDRSGQRAAIGRHRGQDQEAHPLQPLAERRGVHPTIVGDDAAQVGSGRRRAGVEKVLQADEFVGGLVHGPIPPRVSPRCTWPCSAAGRTASLAGLAAEPGHQNLDHELGRQARSPPSRRGRRRPASRWRARCGRCRAGVTARAPSSRRTRWSPTAAGPPPRRSRPWRRRAPACWSSADCSEKSTSTALKPAGVGHAVQHAEGRGRRRRGRWRR